MTALFYLFAAIALIFGALVVICRNPVASALSLVVSFVGVAALFISLDAYFIGIIQILVYAGAVMVLFLFIIMLMDIKAEEERKRNPKAVVGGILLALLFAIQLSTITGGFEKGRQTLQDVPFDFQVAEQKAKIETIKRDLKEETLPDTKLVGEVLFGRYAFQIQLIGALLLVGTIGVVIMSKREIK